MGVLDSAVGGGLPSTKGLDKILGSIFSRKTDPTALQLVFVNLLDNAVKYSGKNIQVFVKIQKVSKGKIDIIIKDSGIGITKTELKKVFKRYYRVDNEATEQMKGSGLGLFIVKEVINKLKGQIAVHSSGKNSGTEFKVTLMENIYD